MKLSIKENTTVKDTDITGIVDDLYNWFKDIGSLSKEDIVDGMRTEFELNVSDDQINQIVQGLKDKGMKVNENELPDPLPTFEEFSEEEVNEFVDVRDITVGFDGAILKNDEIIIDMNIEKIDDRQINLDVKFGKDDIKTHLVDGAGIGNPKIEKVEVGGNWVTRAMGKNTIHIEGVDQEDGERFKEELYADDDIVKEIAAHEFEMNEHLYVGDKNIKQDFPDSKKHLRSYLFFIDHKVYDIDRILSGLYGLGVKLTKEKQGDDIFILIDKLVGSGTIEKIRKLMDKPKNKVNQGMSDKEAKKRGMDELDDQAIDAIRKAYQKFKDRPFDKVVKRFSDDYEVHPETIEHILKSSSPLSASKGERLPTFSQFINEVKNSFERVRIEHTTPNSPLGWSVFVDDKKIDMGLSRHSAEIRMQKEIDKLDN